MSTEENKALARRYIEVVFNQKNVAAIDELNTPDVVLHNASMTIEGREAYKQFVSMYLSAFPDMHMTIEEMIAEGDMVAERVTSHATHKGELMGIPPTGRQGTVTAIYMVRFVNGKGAEVWANADDLGMLQQLGVIPAPGQAS